MSRRWRVVGLILMSAASLIGGPAGSVPPGGEGTIGGGMDPVAVPLDAGLILFADAGAGLTWHRDEDGLIVRPGAGLVLVRVERETIGSGGVEIEFGERRFRVYDGIVVLDTGEDGLRLGILFSGTILESGEDELILDEVRAPMVSLGAGGKTLFHRDLRPLIRDDQARINQVANRSVEILAAFLEREPEWLSSTDLAAMVEAIRLLRLRIPQESYREIHAVLVGAAQREEFVRRHRPIQWPPLLSIPVPVESWDRVFEW